MLNRVGGCCVYGLVFVLSLSAFSQTQKTARDYYSELDKAHGLDGFSNEYVCFRDDPNDEQFLTFSKTQDIAKTYPWENFPANKRAAAKAEFEKPGLLMLGYKKGIQLGEPVVFENDDVHGKLMGHADQGQRHADSLHHKLADAAIPVVCRGTEARSLGSDCDGRHLWPMRR